MPRSFSSALRLFVALCVLSAMFLPNAALFAPGVALAQSDPNPWDASKR